MQLNWGPKGHSTREAAIELLWRRFLDSYGRGAIQFWKRQSPEALAGIVANAFAGYVLDHQDELKKLEEQLSAHKA